MKYFLDVGCSVNPFWESGYEVIRLDIDRQIKKELDILSSGEYLPFRNNSINIVYSSHTIEHVRNPYKFLDECIRVGKIKVIIKCPHRFSKDVKDKLHKYYFSRKWFIKQLEKYYLPYTINIRYDYFNLRFFPFIKFMLPREIIVVISLNVN